MQNVPANTLMNTPTPILVLTRIGTPGGPFGGRGGGREWNCLGLKSGAMLVNDSEQSGCHSDNDILIQPGGVSLRFLKIEVDVLLKEIAKWEGTSCVLPSAQTSILSIAGVILASSYGNGSQSLPRYHWHLYSSRNSEIRSFTLEVLS